MDRCLIDLMLEQAHKMNNMDYTINNQVWIDMVALFKDRFGLQQDKDILRSQCKRLEKQYHEMKALLDQRGFWWDETQQMVRAHDDVWDAYIEVHYLSISLSKCQSIVTNNPWCTCRDTQMQNHTEQDPDQTTTIYA